MKSIAQIFGAVMDGKIATREQAAALVTEECAEYAKVLEISEEEARVSLLANIANAARLYFPPGGQARIADLFSLTLEENDGNQTNQVSKV